MAKPSKPIKKLRYRLITGPDTSAFCERISVALDDGYDLYGSPSITFNGKTCIVAQAVVLKPRTTSTTPRKSSTAK
jgi:hypothetical protein